MIQTIYIIKNQERVRSSVGGGWRGEVEGRENEYDLAIQAATEMEIYFFVFKTLPLEGGGC